MNWVNTTLGEITVNIQTGPFGSQLHQSDYTEAGIPVVMPKDLINGHIDENTIARVQEEHVERLRKHKISKGDILYPRRGDIGKCAFSTDKEEGWLCGTGCLRVTIDETIANPKFVFYQLFTNETKGWIEKHAIGATMLNLNTSILERVPIVLPEMRIQNSIANILSNYDTLIENNQKQIKLLEEAAQRLYKEWFVDLHFPGHEQTRIVDGVPEGWNRVLIGELECRIESGSRPKGGIDNSITKGIASIGAENVIGLGKYDYTSEKLISYEFFNNMKKGKIVDKDILIYKDGAYIGRTSLFQDAFPHAEAAVNEHVFLLHAKDEILQYYLFFTLYQTEYYAKMQKLNKNSAQPGINVGALLSLDLIIPKRELVLEFNRIVAGMVRQIFIKAKQCQRLKEARDLLLPKLMNGEIEL